MQTTWKLVLDCWIIKNDFRSLFDLIGCSFQVTRAMLLWVNNHYSDFEGDPVMEDYLETFEKGLELQVNSRNVLCFK